MQKKFGKSDVVSAQLIKEPVFKLIQNDYPDFNNQCCICRSELSTYRAKYVQSMLTSERGELSDLEKQVLESLQKHELISSNADNIFEQDRTFGEEFADKIVAFGGSWSFIIIFVLFIPKRRENFSVNPHKRREMTNSKHDSENNELVTIFKTCNQVMLGLAKSILDTTNIVYCTKNEIVQDLFGIGTLGGYNPITGPIELQVESDREEDAKILLAELIKD